MIGSLRGGASTAADRLAEHVRTPLYRNGYSLILSAFATSGLGVVYWALAAKFYVSADVGLNSAAISTMMLLSGVAQLNLVGALIRFLPRAGRAAASLVTGTYLVTLAFAAVLALVLVLGRNLWNPVPKLFDGHLDYLLWFGAATMIWGIFALQDSVLTGLRQAKWVPIENVVFAVVKIVLLIPLAGGLPRFGIFISWTLPTFGAVVAMNLLIFLRLIPAHVRETEDAAERLQARGLLSYVASNYVGYLFFLASTTVVPVMVEHVRGASAAAYFFLAWIFAYSLQLVSMNMTASLTVEGAIDRASFDITCYRVLVNVGRLVVPVALLFAMAAPYILSIFGVAYADNGAMALRLLSLAAVPNIINVLYVAIARVRQRNVTVIIVQAILCVLCLGLSALLLGPYGIAGVGTAWLVSQTVVAGVLLATGMRGTLSAAWPGRRSMPGALGGSR